MKKQFKYLTLLVSLLTLGACGNGLPSVSSPSSVPSTTPSIGNPSSDGDVSMEDISITFPPHFGGSEDTPVPPSLSPSSPSPSSASISEEDNSISEADFVGFLANAYVKDEEYRSIGMRYYGMSTTMRNSYVKREYRMTAYTNDITLMEGTYTSVGVQRYSSSYRSQRLYQDGVYSEIRKYDNSFQNVAIKKTMTKEEAEFNLNINQSVNAYAIISKFKTSYSDITYQGVLEEDGSKHATYMHFDEVDDSGYVFAALIDISIDENDYLKDFFYSEGYYDSYYVEDGIKGLRKHGLVSLGSGGYFYEMVQPTLGERTAYTDPLPFPLEENFISELSFTSEEITLSLAKMKEDDQGRKSICLLDYIQTNPVCGETTGAPVNNLQFTSSNALIAQVGDQWYLDVFQVGEVIIDAKDLANQVSSSNQLKINVVE